MDQGKGELRLGSPLLCQLCGEMSYPPFYACRSTCGLNVTDSEKHDIHKTFDKDKLKCHELRKPCDHKRIGVHHLLEHLKDKHFMKSVNTYSSSECVGKKESTTGTVHISLPAEKLMRDEGFRYPAVAFMFKDAEFIFNAVIDPKKGAHGRLMHFWICLDGPESVAKRIRYTLSVSSPSISPDEKKQFKCNRTAHSCSYYDFEKIRSRRETVPLHVNGLIPHCREKAMSQNIVTKVLTVQVQLFKRTDDN